MQQERQAVVRRARVIYFDPREPLPVPLVHERFERHFAHLQFHRMSKNGDAARARNQLGRLRDLHLRLGHVAAFSRQQILVKRAAHRVGVARLHQHARHVRPRHHAARQLHHAIQRNLHAVFAKLTHHLRRALLALHRACAAKFQHPLVVWIKPVTENVNLLLRAAAQLHAGDQRHAAIPRRVRRARKPVHAVVIRQRQMGKAQFRRQRDQLARFERPVRRGGMKVQIRFHVVPPMVIACPCRAVWPRDREKQTPRLFRHGVRLSVKPVPAP